MKGLFLSEKDIAVVTVYLANGKKEKEQLWVSNNKKELAKNKEVDEGTIEEHSITFRKPAYGDIVNIYKMDVQVTGDEINSVDLDLITLRYNQFAQLAVDWTFTDDDGEPVALTPLNIRKLHPQLANLIVGELENLI
jgi:hypothetical protein